MRRPGRCAGPRHPAVEPPHVHPQPGRGGAGGDALCRGRQAAWSARPRHRSCLWRRLGQPRHVRLARTRLKHAEGRDGSLADLDGLLLLRGRSVRRGLAPLLEAGGVHRQKRHIGGPRDRHPRPRGRSRVLASPAPDGGVCGAQRGRGLANPESRIPNPGPRTCKTPSRSSAQDDRRPPCASAGDRAGTSGRPGRRAERSEWRGTRRAR